MGLIARQPITVLTNYKTTIVGELGMRLITEQPHCLIAKQTLVVIVNASHNTRIPNK